MTALKTVKHFRIVYEETSVRLAEVSATTQEEAVALFRQGNGLRSNASDKPTRTIIEVEEIDLDGNKLDQEGHGGAPQAT